MKRVLTASVALPILLYTVWSHIPYFFIGLTAIVVLLALDEFYSLARKQGCQPQRASGYVAAIAIIGCFAWQKPAWIAAVLAALTLASFAIALWRSGEASTALASVSATVFGVVYIAMLAGFLVGVKMITDTASARNLSAKLLTTFFAIVMMTDTGAYSTGRLIGRSKLAPRISPGKTVEGAMGGFVAAVITGPACRLIFFPEIPLADAVVLGAAIGIVGQVGDLAESLLKRGSGVKDSSKLLPGHGGMLDRVDSILFCAPLLYYYSRLIVSGH
jgi:phosphatidate cytidylyltransferase